MRPVTPLHLDRVTRTVGAGGRDESLARARVAALSVVAHPGVSAPLDVVREDDAVVVCSARVAGIPLDTAPRIERAGEWTWLVAGLADAVAALHRAGLAHGDISPANVVVGARPTVIDLVGPALGRERGTPGFAAPERAAGGAPSPAADVHALGAVCLAAAGEPIRVMAEQWMAPLLDPDAAARPSAAAVAAGIERCAPPTRWRPVMDHDPARPVAARAVRTERDAAAWHWRLRRRPGVLAAVLTGATLLAGAALWGPTPLWEPTAPGAHDPGALPSSGTASAAGDRIVAETATEAETETEAAVAVAAGDADREAAAPDPQAAARDLTRTRVDALARADGEALLALTVPGSEAWATAAREARLIADGTRLDGVRVDIGESRTLGVDDGEAVVEVAYGLGSHVRVDADGTRTAMPAQRQRARLTLAWNGDTWRVSAVEAAPEQEDDREDGALSGTP